MRSWARPTAHVALLTAGFVAFGSGVGFADTTSGDGSAGSGNQIKAPISVPIDISGNSAAGAGQSAASSGGGAAVHNQGSGGGTTSGDGGLLSGNQLDAPVSAPVTGCGNALAIGGQSAAECEGGAEVTNSGGGGGNSTSGDLGVLSGNQANTPVSAPTDICGNSVAVFGEANAGCEGGASVRNEGSGAVGSTSGIGGAGAGNQLYAPVSAPVNVCGNAVAVAGQSFATCEGGAEVVNHGTMGTGQTTSGDGSLLGGNQAYAPVSAPISVAGNALSGLGQAAAMAGGGSAVHNAEGAASRHLAAGDTSGDGSLLGGNQAYTPAGLPVSVCGNALAAAGQALAMCDGGASVHNGEAIAPLAARDHMAGGDDVRSAVPADATTNGPVTPGLPEAPVPGLGDSTLPLSSPADGLPGLSDLPVGRLPLAKGQDRMAKQQVAGHTLPGGGALRETPPWAPQVVATGRQYTPGGPMLPDPGVRNPKFAPRVSQGEHVLVPGAPKLPTRHVTLPGWAPQVSSHTAQLNPGTPRLPVSDVSAPAWSPGVQATGVRYAPGAPTIPLYKPVLPNWAAGPVARSGATALPGKAGEVVRHRDVGALPGADAVEQAPVGGGALPSTGDAAGAASDPAGALGGLPIVGGLAGGAGDLGSAVPGTDGLPATEGLPAAGGLPLVGGLPATDGLSATDGLPSTDGLPVAGDLPVTDAVSEGTGTGQGGALGGVAGDTLGKLPVAGGLVPVSAVASLANGVGTYFSLALAAAFVAGSGLLLAARRVRTRGR